MLPKMTTMTVNPGDFGKKFKTFNGEYNAYQRPIRKGHARKMAKNWDAVLASTILLLLQCKDDTGKVFYRILDAQHRLWAASELRSTPTKFMAIIYDSLDVLPLSGPTQVADFICMVNTEGQKFSLNEMLGNYKGHSKWPSVFAKYGLTPSYNAGKRTINWANIVRAATLVESSYLKGEPDSGSSSQRRVLEAWKTWSEAKIERYAKIIAWWEPIAQDVNLILTAHPAVKGHYTAMNSYTLLLMAMLLYIDTKDKKILAHSHMVSKLATNPTLYFRGVTQGAEMFIHVKKFLTILNHRQSKRFGTIFGMMGRETRMAGKNQNGLSLSVSVTVDA
jgi:hypothetical protein